MDVTNYVYRLFGNEDQKFRNKYKRNIRITFINILHFLNYNEVCESLANYLINIFLMKYTTVINW